MRLNRGSSQVAGGQSHGVLNKMLLGLIVLGCATAFTCPLAWAEQSAGPQVASVAELLAQPQPAPDHRFSYGPDPLQFTELRLPEGDGPFPVVVLVHGGCWLAQYDVGHLAAMADALTESGLATWALEFRRVGNEGGGWPGTFQDVSAGTDSLAEAAQHHPLDLNRVVIAGHSAGGHLALWLAARQRLPQDSVLYTPSPLPIKGVVALAPAADLELTYRNQTCGGVSQQLMGGTPEEVPEHYLHGSAAALLPLGLPQVIVNGEHDLGWLEVSRAYREKALALGEDVPIIVPPDVGHFELVMPASSAFPSVLQAIEDLLQ